MIILYNKEEKHGTTWNNKEKHGKQINVSSRCYLKPFQ
jgi:hypothetical protein